MRKRRSELRISSQNFQNYDELMESCIPSYAHRNRLAAFVAWSRLNVATNVFERFSHGGPVLDFGSGSGELLSLLPSETDYSFIEQSEELSGILQQNNPIAKRMILSDLPEQHFGAIFCLDSLEHNVNHRTIVDTLWRALICNGILVLSGPTENRLYRLGRLIAGFSGDYHQTDIFNIERELSLRGQLMFRSNVPFSIPLFRISVWIKTSK